MHAWRDRARREARAMQLATSRSSRCTPSSRVCTARVVWHLTMGSDDYTVIRAVDTQGLEQPTHGALPCRGQCDDLRQDPPRAGARSAAGLALAKVTWLPRARRRGGGGVRVRTAGMAPRRRRASVGIRGGQTWCAHAHLRCMPRATGADGGRGVRAWKREREREQRPATFTEAPGPGALLRRTRCIGFAESSWDHDHD